MIKANELRIGNWAESKGKFVQVNYMSYPMGDEQNRVVSFYPNTKGHQDDHNNLNNLNPIPITSEILESCKVMYKHFADRFYIRIVSGGISIGQRTKGIKYLRNIKYVHQLQNIYFALTGEELEINL